MRREAVWKKRKRWFVESSQRDEEPAAQGEQRQMSTEKDVAEQGPVHEELRLDQAVRGPWLVVGC